MDDPVISSVANAVIGLRFYYLEEQFKDIPTRTVIADTLSEEEKTCPLCGTAMVPIGTELIRSEIVYTPPKLERIEYVATTYACPECKDTEEPQFIKDNGRPALIPGSYVSGSLLAYILYSTFWRPFPKGTKRVIPIRPCRDCSTFFYQAISLLSEFSLPMIVTLFTYTIFVHPAFS